MQARTAGDLIVRLRSRYAGGGDAAADERAFQWHMLDQATSPFFLAAPGINCMLGPLDAQAKVRAGAAGTVPMAWCPGTQQPSFA